MSPFDKGFLLVLILLVAAGLPFSLIEFPQRVVSANVVTINHTWQGGDLQFYENATLSYQGMNTTIILTCNYYTIGSQIQVFYNEKTFLQNPHISLISGNQLEPGC